MTTKLLPQDLYNRAINIEREILLLQEDLKEVRSEFTYHKDENTNGLDKEEVVKIMKAARASAKEDDLAGKAAELSEIIGMQEQFEG